MNKKFDRELLADVAERLITHLQTRTDVQNIDLMNLAGFCRNCLSKWYVEEASALGQSIDQEAARAKIYGMNYAEWKEQYQKPATQEQLDAMQDKQKK